MLFRSRDYDILWDSIKGAILVFLIPFVILTFALNLTYRSSQFYSFYFTRTDVVKDIPFVAEGDDMTHTFSRFMQHRMERFTAISWFLRDFQQSGSAY